MAFFLLNGCATTAQTTHHHPTVKQQPKQAKPFQLPARCRSLGTMSGKYAAVTVHKDCLNKGVTTVTILLININGKAKAAVKESFFLMKEILGFKPETMQLIIASMYKKMPLYVYVITG